ncbi:MAG: putative metal-binding motif-containing protein [Bacteroidales bacterium]
MKRFILNIVWVLSIVMLQAQVPQAFSYKLQIKGNSGNPHANKKINLKISIIQESIHGSAVYIEKHQVNTSPSGLVDIEIGRGTPIQGLFTEIDWKNWPYFVKAELDLKCIGRYNLLAITELLSVPYAMFAGNVTNNNDADIDPENELQVLSISNDTIFLSRGGFVKLPGTGGPATGNFYYQDLDGDGYGNGLLPVWIPSAVSVPDNYVADKTDCDDNDSLINPGSAELFDGRDNNCNNQIDEDFTNCLDKDGDLYGTGADCLGDDCDDDNPDVYPGATDIPNNGIDENCDGVDNTSLFSFNREIVISAPGSVQTDVDVLVEINTAELIQNNKIQANCEDIRIMDSDGKTPLEFWIEGGCNTEKTQIWIRIPTLPAEGKKILITYGDPSADGGELPWKGNFIMMSTTECRQNWIPHIHSLSNNKYLYGSDFYGQSGGNSYHSHQFHIITSFTGQTLKAKSGSTLNLAYDMHSHEIELNSTRMIVEPPYLNVLLCQSDKLDVQSGSLALYTEEIPDGWTRFTEMDGRFPRISSTYGGNGGTANHFHEAQGFTEKASSFSNVESGNQYLGANSNHTHSISLTTSISENLPPYINILFGLTSEKTSANSGTIVCTDVVPPLGWEIFNELKLKFPRGSAQYSPSQSGSFSHSHSIVTAICELTTYKSAYTSGNDEYIASENHTHEISGNTNYESNMPPYFGMIFIRKKSGTKNGLFTVSVGPENNLKQVDNHIGNFEKTKVKSKNGYLR